MARASVSNRLFALPVVIALAVSAQVGPALAQPSAAAPGHGPEDIALARELLGVVQDRLRAEGRAFRAQSRAGAPDGRHRFAAVYGDIMTKAIAERIDRGPSEPVEFAIAALAFLPLYTEVNKTIARTLPHLSPGQPLSRADRRALRRAGVPRHWVAYMQLVQDPRKQNASAETVAGIAAHILGDLKQVVRADLHRIAGDSRQLRRYLQEALPGTADRALRQRVMRFVASPSRYRSARAFQADYDAINPVIAGKTEATFLTIAKSAAAQGKPDFVAELAWRASHGVDPVRFRSLVKRVSRVLFRSWRSKAFADGRALARHDRSGRLGRARAAMRTSRGDTRAVWRIRAIGAAARLGNHTLLSRPLDVAARGLRSWRERSTRPTSRKPTRSRVKGR